MPSFRNPDDGFMDRDQILHHLFTTGVIDPASRDLIRNNFEHPPGDEADAARAFGLNIGAFERDSFGRWIRNSYGLWDPQNPHVVRDPEPNPDGVIDHPLFPDNFSGSIIDDFVSLLRAEESPTDRYFRLSQEAAAREEDSAAEAEADDEDGVHTFHVVSRTTINVVHRNRSWSALDWAAHIVFWSVVTAALTKLFGL